MNSVFLYLGSSTDSNGNVINTDVISTDVISTDVISTDVISTDVTGNSGTEATSQTMLDGAGVSKKNRGARVSSVSLSLITVLFSMLPYHHFA